MNNDYVTTIVAVNAIITFNNKFLLVKFNKKDHKWKLWLVGWKVDKWENFEKALFREIFEETWIIKDDYSYKKLAILHDFPETTCKHLYEVKLNKNIENYKFDYKEIEWVYWYDFSSLPNNIDEYRNDWVYKLLIDYLNKNIDWKLYSLI